MMITKKRPLRLLYAFLLLFFTLSTPSNSAKSATIDEVLQPDNLPNVEFYLLTVDTGPDLYMRFGHTMLRVVDRTREFDVSFNWGMFDFAAPNFALNFFKGILTYFMDAQRTSRVLELYRRYEHRTVWQDTLNLTPNQKRTLAAKLLWNTQKENIFYQYQYFYNNCSTKLRDYLDEATSGFIRKATIAAMTGRNHRYWVRRNLNSPPVVAMSLEVLMNGDIDRPMDKWDEMFLPEKLRAYLQELPQIDDSGNAVPGTQLLGDSKVVLQEPAYPSSPVDGFKVLATILAAPTVLSLLLSAKGTKSQRHSNLARRLNAILLLLISIVSFVFGLVMAITWAISGHTDLHHNANLLLFWPLDFLLAAYGIKLFRYPSNRAPAEPKIDSTKSTASRTWSKRCRWLCWGHVAAILILCIGEIAGLMTQDVSHLLIYVAPWLSIIYANAARDASRLLAD